MFFAGFPEFSTDDLTGFNNNAFCGDDFSFDGPNWDLSNVAGPSQPYTGVNVRGDLGNYPDPQNVQGDLNSYPDFQTPATIPTSLYQTHGVFSNRGKSSRVLQ